MGVSIEGLCEAAAQQHFASHFNVQMHRLKEFLAKQLLKMGSRDRERASCPSLQDCWSRAKTALAFHPDTEVLPNVSATANWFILAFSHFLLLWMRTTVRLMHRKLLMIPVKPLEGCGRIGYPARGKTGAMALDTTMIIQLQPILEIYSFLALLLSLQMNCFWLENDFFFLSYFHLKWWSNRKCPLE